MDESTQGVRADDSQQPQNQQKSSNGEEHLMAIFLRANIYSRETMQHGKENLSGKVSNSWVRTLYVR